MADLVLKDGRIVTLSEEDLEWAQATCWRAWLKAPGAEPQIICDTYANGRTFRRRLHREIAVRFDPKLAKAIKRMRVTFKNGDPFDVRRENLSIRVFPLRRGRPPIDPRPVGTDLRRKKAKRDDATDRNAIGLWNPNPLPRRVR